MPQQAKVALVKTTPDTIIPDYNKVMNLAEYRSALDESRETLVKLNLSWTLFFPACSSPPWQLEGVLKTLVNDRFTVRAVENKTVVTNPRKGAYLNKWSSLFTQYNVEFCPLNEAKWIDFNPKSELKAMHTIFPEGFQIPEMFLNNNIIHLPTVKTHGHTLVTGAVKNAFGGLLKERRHHAHKLIHEILVDLLQIQKEIHPGIFAVMDGTVCGNGAGPRTMIPVARNVLLASEDQVAIDAVAAHLMGFDSLKIPFIAQCHDKGLGTGDIAQIDLIGEDISEMNFHFHVEKSPVIFFDHVLRTSFLEPLFHTPLFRLAILGSAVYHDYVWYPLIGKRRITEYMKTEWGQLFLGYRQ
ncbi:MAG: DUF362 domain-containing protein [Theionarchaea archaeon]|nr:DUF362 domain-containing protein [Theionarchaea archaeon]